MADDDSARESIEEFIKRLGPECPPEKFRPFAWYNAEGDILEVFIEPGESVGRWVGEHIFVHRNREHRVVGLQVWGVRKLIEETDEFRRGRQLGCDIDEYEGQKASPRGGHP